MGHGGRLRSASHAELPENIADVHAGGALGHEQLVADLTVAAAVREQ